jgi:predicted amidophosphoribosyltransferase
VSDPEPSSAMGDVVELPLLCSVCGNRLRPWIDRDVLCSNCGATTHLPKPKEAIANRPPV